MFPEDFEEFVEFTVLDGFIPPELLRGDFPIDFEEIKSFLELEGSEGGSTGAEGVELLFFIDEERGVELAFTSPENGPLVSPENVTVEFEEFGKEVEIKLTLKRSARF